MLFTRCPNCETTFRITADTLRVASGAVRCGNCTTVYSAFSGLRQDTLDSGMQPVEDFLSPTMQTQELAAIEEIASPDIVDAPTISDASVEPDAAADAAMAPEPANGDAADSDEPAAPPADTPVELALEEPAAEPVVEGSGAAGSIAPAETTDREHGAEGSGATSGSLRFEVPTDDEWTQVLKEIEEGTGAERSADPASDRELDQGDPDDGAAEPVSYGAPLGFFDIGEPNSLAGSPHATSPQTVLEPQPEARASADGREAIATAVAIDAALDGERSDEPTTGEVSISAEEVDATLSANPDADLFAALQTPVGGSSQPGNRRLMWRFGAAAMAVLLVAQVVHDNRALLATQPGVGALLHTTYAAFGVTLAPDWNLDQYEISNWAATAGETEDGIGNLRITAQIRNGGPTPQPFPSIQLELKDRWETVIGRRIFTPSEYLGAKFVADTLMAAGETVPAELAVVDPGLDASGFELDVCVANSNTGYRCAADRVFD